MDGRRLKLSNLDKVLYPTTGTTKGEVIDYYRRIAPLLVPQAAQRPATRKRWVDGVGTADKPGKVFFRKDLEDHAPDWVPRADIEHSDGVSTYPLIDETAVLAWLAQLAALEIHTPQWRFTADLEPDNPDRLVLDLDPGEGADLIDCARVAGWCREILTDMGLETYPVTSGSKGIHLYAPLDGDSTADEIATVAHQLARALEEDHPDHVVSDMKKSLRRGKVLVDWSQNNGHKTTICPYSLRGRLEPTVAAPPPGPGRRSRTPSSVISGWTRSSSGPRPARIRSLRSGSPRRRAVHPPCRPGIASRSTAPSATPRRPPSRSRRLARGPTPPTTRRRRSRRARRCS